MRRLLLSLGVAFPAPAMAQSPPWEPHTLRTLRVEGGSVDSLAFSPDGDFLAVGGSSGEVVLWHLPDETVVARFVCPDAGVQQVTFLDGGLLLTVDDQNVCLWKLQHLEEPLWRLPRARSPSYPQTQRAAVSADQELVAFPSEDSQVVQVFELESGREVARRAMGSKWLVGVRFVESDDVLLVHEPAGSAYRWSWRTAEEPQRMPEEERVYSTALLAGGVEAFGLWNSQVRIGSRTLPQENTVSGVAASADGQRLAVTVADRPQVRVYSLHGVLVGEVRHGVDEPVAALDAPGERLATAGRDGSVRVWQDFELVHELEGPVVWRSWRLDLSPDGDSLGVILPSRKLRVFDLRDGSHVDVDVQGTCVAPGRRDGEFLVGENARVLAFDGRSGRVETLCPVPGAEEHPVPDPQSLHLGPSGDLLILDGSLNHYPGLHAIPLDGRTPWQLDARMPEGFGQGRRIHDVAWGPDGAPILGCISYQWCGNSADYGDLLAVALDPDTTARVADVLLAPCTVDVSAAHRMVYWSDRASTFRARYPELEPVEARPEGCLLFRCVDGESAVSCDGDRLVRWNLSLFEPQAAWRISSTSSGWLATTEPQEARPGGELLKARYNPARRRVALVRDREILVVELR